MIKFKHKNNTAYYYTETGEIINLNMITRIYKKYISTFDNKYKLSYFIEFPLAYPNTSAVHAVSIMENDYDNIKKLLKLD